MSKPSIHPPNFEAVLRELKSEIFAQLNCIQIGKIEKFTAGDQSAEIQIMVKRRIDDTEIRSYPVLVDCPVFVLQGGGAYLDMPIAKGDYCLVLFNDRNIDTWWTAAQEAEPATRRKHSLSDGIALVGLNPKTSALSFNGSSMRLVALGNEVELSSTGITLKTGDASAWLPNILPNCLFTGSPHGGAVAGIVKLKGG